MLKWVFKFFASDELRRLYDVIWGPSVTAARGSVTPLLTVTNPYVACAVHASTIRYLWCRIDSSLRIMPQMDHCIRQARAERVVLFPALAFKLSTKAKLGIFKTYIRSCSYLRSCCLVRPHVCRAELQALGAVEPSALTDRDWRDRGSKTIHQEWRNRPGSPHGVHPCNRLMMMCTGASIH